MFIRSSLIAVTTAACAALPLGAAAQDVSSSPTVFSDVVACRAIADPGARLACFDAKTATLDTAVANKDVVVMSREAVKETRRGLFGFSLPRLGLFRDGGDEADEVKELNTTITAISGGNGRWVLTLEDGAVWEQTDGSYINRPSIGQPILIDRGALGSYMGRIDKGKAFRIKRRS